MATVIRLCLCDDDPQFLAACRKKADSLIARNNLEVETKEFESGESLLFFLDENVSYFDFIMMDMLMGEHNGIETVQILRDHGYEGIVVFLTSSKEYALESFSVAPFNYVLKQDMATDAFDKIFLDAIEAVKKAEEQKLVISTRRSSVVMNLDDIIYIESNLRKLIFHTVNGNQDAQYALDDVFTKTREHGFLRCHKSFVVNSRFVKSCCRTEVVLTTAETIPLGRTYADDFEHGLLKCLREKITL
ncbi:MAG: LytTR family DNA-binding domain-containing protein [Raoultibacter sp.]